ncbi:MAG: hypothetical protein LAT55_07200 [Opitutales bacterium]|nr:hypothetical protein [Opitutales bacterium]
MRRANIYPFALALVLVLGVALWLTRQDDSPSDSAEAQTTPAPTAESAESTEDLSSTSIAVEEPAVVSNGEIPAQPSPPTTAMNSFDEWAETSRPKDSEAEAEWLAQGIALARERREVMALLISEDPEQAILAAISPRRRAQLPAEVRSNLEELITDEGFYGVLASCNHAPGEEHLSACEISHEVVLDFGTFDARFFNAHIYGQRERRLTEENTSLNGVAVEQDIALYEYDALIFDDGEEFAPKRFAVYYRGQEHLVDTLEEAEALQARFQKSPDGLF